MRLPIFTILYVTFIVAANYGFSVIPMIELPGGAWSPMDVVIGFVFVIRDFAQREIGHRVLLAMLIGATLSYLLADPFVAFASLAAFLVSELADWAVYSYTKKPLSQRILLSSALSTPIDTVIFLGIIGALNPVSGGIQITAKMLGALGLWYLLRRRELAKSAAPTATP